MRLTWQQCADILLTSRTTLWRRCQELDLNTHNTTFSTLSDGELDAIMQMLVERYPRCGSVMMMGHLRGFGVYVPRRRVRESMLRVCPRLVELRSSTTVIRRAYNVASSNALWHIDGLHCFIRWRIVIHAGIDGYSRRIVYIHASTNNRADTVLKLFVDATRTCGWPSRVRSDCGGENVGVARAMIMCRGLDRSSHITGSSVHNQRIERLWRDTFTSVCHTFYNVFYEMEDSGLLTPTDDKHLYCLHYIFLPRINLQLQQFMVGWNNHSLRTESGLTPLQLWTRGMCLASPNILQQPALYGVEADTHNPFDRGANVIVPETVVNLTPLQMAYIEHSHQPMAHSDYLGVDLYLSLWNTLSAMIS